MNMPVQIRYQDDFSKCIRWSLVGHFVVAAFMIFRAVFYPSVPIFIQRAIRVDMVALPTKSQFIANPSTPVPIPVEVKLPEPIAPPVTKKLPDVKKIDPKKIDLKKSTTAQDDAIKRLQAFKKLAEMSKAKEPIPAKSATPIRGSVLAAGSSITGLNKIDYNDYLEKLDDKIKSHWNLPSLLKNQSFTATVMVYIDGSGNITKKVLAKSSGNSVFDEKCLEAIEHSSPFDRPPEKLANILAVDGIEFGFPE